MLVFLDCLRFSKLLEILPSVWYNFNNLLKRKQSSRKTSIVCRRLIIAFYITIIFYTLMLFLFNYILL